MVTAFADNPSGRLIRGPDLPGRRGPVAGALGAVRRRGPHGAQRPELHRARIRRARRRWAAPTAATPPPRSSKPGEIDWDDIFGRAGRALVPHRRHFLRAVGDHARRGHRGHAGGPRHGVVVSYDLNYRASLWKAIGGKQQGAGGQPAHRAAGGRDDRQRGGLLGRAGLRGSRRGRELSAISKRRAFRTDDRAGS